jgi:hypothetical protein
MRVPKLKYLALFAAMLLVIRAAIEQILDSPLGSS